MSDRRRAGAFAVLGLLWLVACDGGSSSNTTAAPATVASVDASSSAPTAASSASTPPGGSASGSQPPGSSGWTVHTAGCADPRRVEQPIEGTVRIGAVMPLTGGPAAVFGPVKDGFQLYLNYADENGLLPGYTLAADIGDDQYDATQTPAAVQRLLDDGVNLFSGIIGSPNNLAVRQTLNDECVPQLLALTGSPAWGQAQDYPWTTGALTPYDVEASIYATKLAELKPNATVAIYSVDNDFGKAYLDAFKARAGEHGLTIVEEQTVGPDVNDPPTAQVASIAGEQPDAIVAVPLGLQCPAFLGELGNVRAQTAGWNPLVFLTNTCASKLFFGLAGPAADGVYTSNHLIDANDPKNASTPAVRTFLDAYGAAGLTGDPGVTEAGWTVGEITVAILAKALESGTLSRRSVIEAARNMTFTPSLARPGVQYKMNGTDDPYAFQTLQVLQWSVATQTFSEVGEPIADFEQ